MYKTDRMPLQNFSPTTAKMICVTLFILAAVFALSNSEQCAVGELSCDNGSCIPRSYWCDNSEDCLDSSDEMYCTGEEICLEDLHFTCRNGFCVPLSALCDGYSDCDDYSDEEDCITPKRREIVDDSIFPQVSNLSQAIRAKNAVAKAAEYLRQSHAHNDWNDFTPRAAIAFAFASKVSTMAEKEKEIMKKQLDVNFLFRRMEKRLSTSSLALYINALYATCQEPHNYEGINLVRDLHWDTMNAMKSNSSLPISFLTLCIADADVSGGMYELTRLYNSEEFQKTTSKALIVMAMICLSNKQNNNVFELYLMDFFSKYMPLLEDADVYSTALLTQVAIASGSSVNLDMLLNKQQEDGSFGDVLATYYAIPALLNSSFLDLRCNETKIGKRKGNLMMQSAESKKAIISIWRNTGKEAMSHSLTLTFDGDKSLYDLMLMAAEKDPQFRFSFDKTNEGKKIFSISGVPNDIETERSWMLYSGSIGHVTLNSMQNLRLIEQGIDLIEVENNTEFVFWHKRT